MKPAEGFNWPRLAARCNEGDRGVRIRLGGRSRGKGYWFVDDDSGTPIAGCEALALVKMGGNVCVGNLGELNCEAFLLRFV